MDLDYSQTNKVTNIPKKRVTWGRVLWVKFRDEVGGQIMNGGQNKAFRFVGGGNII